jgi:hypothetical protein
MEAQYLSHLNVLLYVTSLNMEPRYLSYFTSQPSSQKHDTRLALRHIYLVGISVLVLSYHLALCLTNGSEARYTSHLALCLITWSEARYTSHLSLRLTTWSEARYTSHLALHLTTWSEEKYTSNLTLCLKTQSEARNTSHLYLCLTAR